MGFWIFKSAKEKFYSNMFKEMKQIRKDLAQDEEMTEAEYLYAELQSIKKALYPPEPKQGSGSQLPIPKELLAQWEGLDGMIKTLLNGAAKAKFGVTVDEAIKDPAKLAGLIQKIPQIGSLFGLQITPKPSSPSTTGSQPQQGLSGERVLRPENYPGFPADLLKPYRPPEPPTGS